MNFINYLRSTSPPGSSGSEPSLLNWTACGRHVTLLFETNWKQPISSRSERELQNSRKTYELRTSQFFKFAQHFQCILLTGTAHFRIRLQGRANGGTLRHSEDAATHIFVQIDTRHTCRFTMRHSGYRGGYRWSNTAGSAFFSAFQFFHISYHTSKPIRIQVVFSDNLCYIYFTVQK